MNRSEKKSGMMVMRKILLVWAAMAAVVSAGEIRTEKYVGRATDLKNGVFLYTEEHTAYYEDGGHRRSDIEYRDAVCRRIILALKSNYSGFKIAKMSDGISAG